MNPPPSKTARLRAAGISLCLWTTIGFAQTNYNFEFPINLTVPDGNASGLALQADLTGMGRIITNLTLSLNISGDYNGDLYVYLAGPTAGFAVLLNRVGAMAMTAVVVE